MKRPLALAAFAAVCVAVIQLAPTLGLDRLAQIVAAFAGILALMAAGILIALSAIAGVEASRPAAPAPGPRVPAPMPVPSVLGVSLPRMSDAPEDPPDVPDGLDTATGELVGDRVNRLEELTLGLGRKLEEQAELMNTALVTLGRQVQRLTGPGPFVGEAQADEEAAP